MESLQPLRIFPAEVCKQLNMIQQKCLLAKPCGNFFKTLPPPIHYLCIRGSVVL